MDMQKDAAPVAAPLMSERRVSLVGAMLIGIGPLSMALYTPAMPAIVETFGTTEAAVKMTLSLYFAGFAVAQLVCGPLSDGLGRKPVTIAFLGVYVVASLLAMMAPSVEMLIAARFLQGFGGGVGVAIARALVRDLFTQEQSARIMNLMGIVLACAPALAPTVGGLTLEFTDWHALFAIMLACGLLAIVIVHVSMRETVSRDLSRMSPSGLLGSYGTLLKSGYFISSSVVAAGTVGAVYTLATILPFILMNRVGLSPAVFGVGMLMQSGMFLLGSVLMRFTMRRVGAYNMVPVGLGFIAVGSLLLIFFLNTAPPSFLRVMGPIGLYSIGIAFVMPAMMTASLAPFPHMAGAASALAGFMQMGGGLLGGSIAALMGDPVFALSVVVPAMGATAIAAWLFWRTLPEPAMARRIKIVNSE